jgi:hypothetical protein
MNIDTPDLSVTPEEFARRMRGFCAEAQTQEEWLFRETYVDRCFLEPYYILEFRSRESEPGDDLYDQELFGTDKPYLSFICLTREAKTPGGTYWKEISRSALLSRLDNFTTMYMGDYLQPAGYRGDLHRPRERHEIFNEKRFIYKIQSPRDRVVSIGSRMYAGFRAGAVCGTVFDENAVGLDGIKVELLVKDKSLTRQTSHGGLFWFSRIPVGPSKIRIKERSCVVRVIRYDEFGSLKGWLADQNGNPIFNAEVRFKAPDEEIFSAFTDVSGKFATGPLPAYPAQSALLERYPYVMSIPDFLFTVLKDIKVDDAEVGGTLKNTTGEALAGKTIILKKEGQEVARTSAGTNGAFLFTGLRGGRHQLEVPGSRIYAAPMSGGAIEGRAPDSAAPLVLEIFVSDRVVRTERSDGEGQFNFSNVAPGTYELKYRKLQG